MDNSTAALMQDYLNTRDESVRNEIVLKNLGLVRACALSLRNMYIKFGDVDDVVNEGVIALMEAIESYDPEVGAYSYTVNSDCGREFMAGGFLDGNIYLHDGSRMYGVDANTYEVTDYGYVDPTWQWTDAATAPVPHAPVSASTPRSYVLI